MFKGFWGWSLENINKGKVETKYIVEYVNDVKIWERICYIDDNHSEIKPRRESWELCNKKEYDNISDALTFYMIMFISDNCFDIKWIEQIYINDEMVLEQYIEPKATVYNRIKDTINRDMNNKIEEDRREINELENELEMYKSFVKVYNSKKLFDKYVIEKIEGRT
jgi:hypothetical protein